ncbi:MAG: tripartite tricarboxylate transporter substrate binding protein [Gammaproteobacteria bacterium]|nr:tripartite tricarboxylate transporter substrate binding protein [Gammaproteobacteria bacterium]MBU1441918.1 tripartite tricarboxylate transporter substrate binding protein [Gammaproteobacteria bacterium]MBU2287543.1 tripartite tricarboxylate transporter substrate binding protein [Gammaproteobacteria bacterium]MBU2410354.1 tripartite tricarboxylate transporter substrate binding protein [Gammaproteobacteria bacterium]
MHTPTKRRFLKQLTGWAAAGLATPLVVPMAVAAPTYPDRPIKLIIPFPPGGSVDPIARVLTTRLGDILGQAFVVDNRPGGNTAIGAGMVAKAPPDGYTLLFTAASTHVIHTLQTSLPYDSIKDFAPVGTASRSSYMLAVHKDVPVKTLPELIAYAKARPGQLNYGSSGTGNSNHLAGELFNIRTGVKIVHVPYKGGAPALQDLVAGRVQMMITNVPLLQPQVDAGTLRALAYTSQQPGMPPVPTFSQYGLTDFDGIESLNVLLAPAGTPEPIIAKLSAAMQKALADPEVKRTIEVQKQNVFYQSPAELGQRMRADRDKYVEVIDKANIKLAP